MRRNCLKFRRPIKLLQVFFFQVISGGVLISAPALGQVSRAPANFVPDDDQILVPMVIEKNMMDEFHEKHQNKFSNAKRKIRNWLAAEEYAKAYGFEENGVVDLPTAEEKQKFFEKNYLRYISKDFERGANRTAQELVEDWSADDEFAAKELQEEREKFIIKAKRKSGRKSPEIKKEVKVGKSKFRFDIQVRPEMGMVKMRLKSAYFEGNAWVGVNGNQELQIERKFKSTGTKAEVNYYIEQKRVLARVDQRLARHLSLRFSHDKIESDGIYAVNGESYENNILQIRFGMGF